MTADVAELIRSDWRRNFGPSFDRLRACLLLSEVRLEQGVHRWAATHGGRVPLATWGMTRFLGSIYQWIVASSNIPGSAILGRALRLPHPTNIIVGAEVTIGDECTLYQGVTIAGNNLRGPTRRAVLGDHVIVGAHSLIIGAVDVGDWSIVAAGAVVSKSVPAFSLATAAPITVRPRTDLAPRDVGYPVANPDDGQAPNG